MCHSRPHERPKESFCIFFFCFSEVSNIMLKNWKKAKKNRLLIVLSEIMRFRIFIEKSRNNDYAIFKLDFFEPLKSNNRLGLMWFAFRHWNTKMRISCSRGKGIAVYSSVWFSLKKHCSLIPAQQQLDDHCSHSKVFHSLHAKGDS